MTAVVEIALFTEDVEGARRFYELLLASSPDAEWPGGAIYSAGELKLLVHERSPGTEEGSPPNEDHVALAVSDLDALWGDLAARGLDVLVPPRSFPWGRSAYLRDPDGRLVELVEA